jgi:hypothetical protein
VLFDVDPTSGSRRSPSTTPSSATPTTRDARRRRALPGRVAEDDDITVVLLRGADGVFSTGADMNNAYGWYGEAEATAEEPTQSAARLTVDRKSSASTTT